MLPKGVLLVVFVTTCLGKSSSANVRERGSAELADNLEKGRKSRLDIYVGGGRSSVHCSETPYCRKMVDGQFAARFKCHSRGRGHRYHSGRRSVVMLVNPLTYYGVPHECCDSYPHGSVRREFGWRFKICIKNRWIASNIRRSRKCAPCQVPWHRKAAELSGTVLNNCVGRFRGMLDEAKDKLPGSCCWKCKSGKWKNMKNCPKVSKVSDMYKCLIIGGGLPEINTVLAV